MAEPSAKTLREEQPRPYHIRLRLSLYNNSTTRLFLVHSYRRSVPDEIDVRLVTDQLTDVVHFVSIGHEDIIRQEGNVGSDMSLPEQERSFEG